MDGGDIASARGEQRSWELEEHPVFHFFHQPATCVPSPSDSQPSITLIGLNPCGLISVHECRRSVRELLRWCRRHADSVGGFIQCNYGQCWVCLRWFWLYTFWFHVCNTSWDFPVLRLSCLKKMACLVIWCSCIKYHKLLINANFNSQVVQGWQFLTIIKKQSLCFSAGALKCLQSAHLVNCSKAANLLTERFSYFIILSSLKTLMGSAPFWG